MTPRRFALVRGEWTVARLDPAAALPTWAAAARGFVSVTRTPDELSIVCASGAVPAGVTAEAGWALLRLIGPFPFDTVGVLAGFAGPLAAAGVSLFALSTFDTDYILVKASQLETALEALGTAGHALVD